MTSQEHDVEQRKLKLNTMWAEAERKFQTNTDKRLKTDPPKTLDDVIREYEARTIENESDQKNSKKRARDTIQKVIQCVQLLGGIAAQGASIVFGPAGLCFNAVSFLLTIPSKVSDIYDGLGELFGKISVFLSQFKIYERIEQFSNIDTALESTIHELMISFVNICGLSTKILKGGFWQTTKLVLKVTLFDEKYGIPQELQNLESLVRRQSAIVGTLTLESALGSENKLTDLLKESCNTGRRLDDLNEEIRKMESGIDFMVSAEKGRRGQELQREQLETIAKSLLGVKEEQENEEESIKTHRSNRGQSTTDTGSWLWDVQEYSMWVDRNTNVDPVLLLVGDEHCGKSFLTSAVVNMLQSRFARLGGHEGSTRTKIAWYFFSRADEKTNEKIKPVETALKYMALQIARDDKVYRKELLARVCDVKDSPDFNSMPCNELWQKLGFNWSKTAATYFLLFDGLSELDRQEARKLGDIMASLQNSPGNSGQLRLRVLVTGKEDFFRGLFLGTFPRIKVWDHNRKDIENYIQGELKESDTLQGEELGNVRNKILEELPTKTRGDFFKIKHWLNAIKEARVQEDITEILSKADQDGITILKQKMRDFEAKSSDESIGDLNELLSWAIFSFDWLKVDQLQTVLSLRYGQKSLLPLGKRLENEYAQFFQVDEQKYVWVDDEVEELLKASQESASNKETDAESKTSRRTDITKGEIRMVEKFLRTFCEDEVFHNFGFEEFFAQKMKARATIGVNEKLAHLKIVKQSLKLLLGENNEKPNPLTFYALPWLPRHLEAAGDLSQISSSEKSIIGKDLVRLLQDEDMFRRCWRNSMGDPSLIWNWASSDAKIETFCQWLQDSTVVKDLGEDEKGWLTSVKLDFDAGLALLKPVTRVVAKRWLRSRESDLAGSFLWVHFFVAKSRLQKGEIDVIRERYEIDVTDIDIAASWVKKELEVEELDSLWYERLGKTFFTYKDYKSAIEAFTESRNHGSIGWEVEEGLAKSFAEQKEWSLAAEAMEKLLEIFRNSDGLRKENSARFCRNLRRLATWRIECEQPDKAIMLYEEGRRIDPDEYKCTLGLLKVLLSQGRITDAHNLLDGMSKQPAEHPHCTELVRIHHKLALNKDRNEDEEEEEDDDDDDENEGEEDYYGTIFSIAQRSKNSVRVWEALETAIMNARETKQNDVLGVLLFYHGTALAHYADQDIQTGSAADLWEECYELAMKSQTWRLLKAGHQAVRQLCTYYFSQAIAVEHDSQEAQAQIKKLIRFTASADNKTAYDFLADGTAELSRLFLGRYYRFRGEDEKARGFLRGEVQSSLDLLSDEDPDNDWVGYLHLAEALMHYGDDRNALSAWSLIGPTDLASLTGSTVRTPAADEEAENTTSSPDPVAAKVRPGTLHNNCDGRCGKRWAFADDFYCCRYCPDVQFDLACLNKLREGTLRRDVCSAEHSWLHVPKWSDEEYLKVGKGRVRVGGEFEDGVRVGGTVVDIETWLDSLREEWGMPKPEKSKSGALQNGSLDTAGVQAE